MGNFRPRVKGKGKRWAKGQSSSSNPDTRKHRDSAKSRFFHENLGQTGLTTEALRKHDAFSGVKSEELADDAFTVSDSTFKTFGTFASDWSSCSNQSFSRLLNGFRADSAIHKEMLAVLAAVTEVLKSKGGKENEAEYFMALMTTLEVTDSVESIAAILSLMGMSIKKVPDTVLRAKFSEATKTLVDILGAYAESDNNIIIRSVIGCLSVLLRAQEAVEWGNSSTLQIYDSILAFTIHVKPKVRKAAQHAVCAILKGSCFMLSHPNADDKEKAKISERIHPAAAHTAKFCIQEMERVSSLGSGSTSTLHMLGLLKEIVPCFPKTQLKATCECILKVMTLGNVLVTSCGMQALHGLLVSRPSSSSFPPELNARLIAALFQYQPPPNDIQPLMAWLVVMQEAYSNLALQDLNLCMGNVPKLFSTCTQLWLSDRQEVMTGATNATYTVIKDCISLAAQKVSSSQDKQHKYLPLIQKCFGFVQAGLQYQYHHAWKHVFHLMSVMFEVCGAGPCQNFMLPCLKSLAELRDSDKFTYGREVDLAIGKAVTSFGPKAVLTAIPFNVTGEEKSYEFPRSWLLPVLKDNIKNSELQIFGQVFLPIASLCRKKSLELEGKNEKVGAHTYDLLQAQIWSLLPSFCNGAKDVKTNFKNIAKILGMAISDRKDLRLDVMLSLRRLISKSLDTSEEDQKELGRFAKNYLPILFNLYTTQPNGSEEAGQRLAAFETIKLYLRITEPSLCSELFDRAFGKLMSFNPGLTTRKRKKKKGKKVKETQEPMEEDKTAPNFVHSMITVFHCSAAKMPMNRRRLTG
ncbi:hypothetical protein J437_LFUL017765 [Ladona fulva]|uniref:RRP12-like protein n=1 Tax=Ladona fulva TaxID=123851 RepID=A0A8K0PBJ0_LADFU|nr:hypothetical protein J437_LFUL017765 [Ladona fulva]